jgi:hypothetical protein
LCITVFKGWPKSPGPHLLAERLTGLLGDDLKAQAALEQREKPGKPFERLFVSPINQPVKSAA